MKRTATALVPTVGRTSPLRRLLETLAAQTVEVQTIVIDNGSPDQGVQEVCERQPSVTHIRFERNAGYSRAMNEGARRADGDALVLLNDDSTCEPAYVAELLAALDPAAGVTMASAVLMDSHEPGLIDTAGIELDRTLMVMDYLNGAPLEVLEQAPDPLGPAGASAAFDREAFLTAGGFDEQIFAYWEDVDLILRLRRAGMRCVLARAARGSHEHSATLGAGSCAKNYLMGFGRGYVLRKWGVLSPSRLAPVLVREAGVCLGQAVADRNLAGLRGRLEGFRAATPTETYPDDLGASGWRASTLAGLRRRLARRRRLQRRLR